MKRREFVKAFGVAVSIVPIALMLKARALQAAPEEVIGEDKLIKADSDPVAKALKYNHVGSSSADRKDVRQGVAAKDQACANCALFTKTGKMKNGDEVGKCTMLQGGLVKSKGWCASWSKKG